MKDLMISAHSKLPKQIGVTVFKWSCIKKNNVSKREISEKYKIPLDILVKDSRSIKEQLNIILKNKFCHGYFFKNTIRL